MIASATWYIAISFPFIMAVFWMVQKYYLRTSRQLRFMDLEAKSPLYTQFLESLSGLATIRAFGWQEQSEALNKELLDASQKPFYLLFMIQRWLTLVLDLVGMALALIVVGLSVQLRDSVSAGFAGVSLVNIISFTAYIKALVTFWTIVETSIGAVSRIKAFSTDVVPEYLEGETFKPHQTWPSNGQLEIQEITAAYNEYDTNKDIPPTFYNQLT
jgi:ATP-binding cassette subfamily C (CFTR/MRP) protein 1